MALIPGPLSTGGSSSPFSTGFWSTGGVKTPGSNPGQQVTTSPPPSPSLPGGFYSSGGGPWYTTWWGIGLIGVAGFLGYRKFIAKK